MAKANIVTPSGMRITVEGSPQEVAQIVSQVRGDEPPSQNAKPTGKATKRSVKEKPSPINLLSSLIDGGFFRKPKDLGAVKVALEEMGHYYPVTSLSPTLLRLVRKRQLRRLKDNKRWLYTG
jgi:hypothetical protein